MKLGLAAMLLLAAAAARAECPARVDVTGLPLRTFAAAAGTGDTFVVMLTGDGGWRAIDEKVTDPLRAAGLPVVGFLTPPYFGRRKSPEESACALERTIRFYAATWRKPRVVLIGYSRGADVLPFLISRLPTDVRRQVRLTVLLGLEGTIDFRFHSPWWLGRFIHEPQFPVQPEMEKLRGLRLVCVYGQDEKQPLCPGLDPTLIERVAVPGGHHFAGQYTVIGERIVRELR